VLELLRSLGFDVEVREDILSDLHRAALEAILQHAPAILSYKLPNKLKVGLFSVELKRDQPQDLDISSLRIEISDNRRVNVMVYLSDSMYTLASAYSRELEQAIRLASEIHMFRDRTVTIIVPDEVDIEKLNILKGQYVYLLLLRKLVEDVYFIHLVEELTDRTRLVMKLARAIDGLERAEDVKKYIEAVHFVTDVLSKTKRELQDEEKVLYSFSNLPADVQQKLHRVADVTLLAYNIRKDFLKRVVKT